MADSSILGGFVLPTTDDKSVKILNSIIGNVDNMITGASSTPAGHGDFVFADMMMYFNHVLLGAGTVLFAIMVFVGTMNTSNEGSLFGRQWHSMWTPMRLIFGLIFVVPLKSGLCMGQKIILYAILIGITMGTNVWSNVIEDVVKNSAIPPVPSYMRQQIQGQVAKLFFYDSIAQAYKKITNKDFKADKVMVNTRPKTIPLYTSAEQSEKGAESAPHFVQVAVEQEGGAICDNLFDGLKDECKKQVQLAVSSQSSGIYRNQADSGVTYYVGIGSGIEPSDVGNEHNDHPPSVPPVGSMFSNHVENVRASKNPNLVGPQSAWPFSENGRVSVNNMSLDMSSGNPLANAFSSKAKPDHKVTILASAIKLGKIDDSEQLSSQGQSANQDMSATDSVGSSKGQEITQNISKMVKDHVIRGDACTGSKCRFSGLITDYIHYLHNNLDITDVPGLECKGKDAPGGDHSHGKCTYDPTAKIPQDPNQKSGSKSPTIELTNSWWWAGESYLIIDRALSEALSRFHDQVEEDLGSVGPAAGIAINSAYLIRNQISVWEMGPELRGRGGQQGTCQSIFVPQGKSAISSKETAYDPGFMASDRVLSPVRNYRKTTKTILDAAGLQNYWNYQSYVDPSIALQPKSKYWPFVSCLADESRGSHVMTHTFWAINKGVMSGNTFPDMRTGGTKSWAQLIAIFNPKGDNSRCKAEACSQAYSDLQTLPSSYRFPVAMMIEMLDPKGGQDSVASGDQAGDGQTTFDMAAAYIVRSISILNQNEILPARADAQLPIHESLSKMFKGLLGDDSNNITESTGGALQELYNLGQPSNEKGFNLASKQYSMIQRAQSAGVSLMETAVNSVSEVYGHFADQLRSLNDYIRDTSLEAGAGAAIAGAAGMIPGVGELFAGMSSATITAAQVIIQLKVLTVMTTIGMAMAWLPLAAFVLVSLFTAGIQFAFLVPLMPYILFWAGQIAWLLGVLEAVVAAPIIMLGLATPGGHDFMGHTVPAIKMLLGVVFRPVLMIIGLVTGILLTYVVLTFSSQGFHAVTTLLLQNVPAADSDVKGILSIIAIITYGTFLVLAFTKCFSPIYLIPEKVMQWVGGQADRAGQEEMQQMQSSVQQSSQKTGESGQQGVSSSTEAQKQKTQQTSQAAQQGLQGGAQSQSQMSGAIRNKAEQQQAEQGKQTDIK